MSLNRVVLVGRLTRDPELRYTPSGVAVGNFTIAINRPFTNQEGNREADFINCVVWRKPAENLANYMKKGNQVGVDGRLQSRSYEQDGRTVYVTEVVADSIQYLESKSSQQSTQSAQNSTQSNQNNTQNNQNSTPNQTDPFANNGDPIDINDDDLPF